MNTYTIIAIIAQRKEKYDGEYAPETLDAYDEFGFDDNPEWLEKQLEEYNKCGEFESVKAVRVTVPFDKIMEILRPKNEVSGSVSNL